MDWTPGEEATIAAAGEALTWKLRAWRYRQQREAKRARERELEAALKLAVEWLEGVRGEDFVVFDGFRPDGPDGEPVDAEATLAAWRGLLGKKEERR